MSGTDTRSISRRGFVQTVAGVASAHLFAPAMHALATRSVPAPRLACRAVSDGIETLTVRTARTGLEVQDRVGFFPCESPAALALGSTGRVLYVAHRTGIFENLPCGSVGTYRVDARGAIAPLHRERLSLACTHPDALALSPDDALLAVASRRAGILNVLPLDTEGRPGAVTAVRRELQWSHLAADEPLQTRFVGDSLLSVTAASWQRPALYRCTLDEIVPIESGSRYNGSLVASLPVSGNTSLLWLDAATV